MGRVPGQPARPYRLRPELAARPMGVAAKLVVQRADGRVLIIKRAPASAHDPGRWDLPGGKMQAGERLAEALIREAREETGLAVQPGRPFHVCNYEVSPFWVTCVTFECAGFAGRVELSSEHVDSAWISLEDLPRHDFAQAVREQLTAYAELKR